MNAHGVAPVTWQTIGDTLYAFASGTGTAVSHAMSMYQPKIRASATACKSSVDNAVGIF